MSEASEPRPGDGGHEWVPKGGTVNQWKCVRCGATADGSLWNVPQSHDLWKLAKDCDAYIAYKTIHE